MALGQELAFEYLALALEATSGTAEAAPTVYLPVTGMITPVREKYRPDETRGTLAEYYRSQTVRTHGEWTASGGVDPHAALFVLNMIVGSVTTPTTPTNGVLTRLWTFPPAMTSDTLKSATAWFGDPNIQIWRSTYCMADELTVSADANSTDAATWELNGWGRYPTAVADPTLPSQSIGSLLIPGAMQLWIDTSSAIGTTEVTGRFISTDWTIPTGASQKWYAGGPTGGLNFTKHGRGKRHAEATITLEMNSAALAAEFAAWEADTPVKMRIRLNGALIESVTPDYYEYLQLDIYGPLDSFEWGDVADTNRTISLTVLSEYNAAAGYDFALSVQNTVTSL